MTELIHSPNPCSRCGAEIPQWDNAFRKKNGEVLYRKGIHIVHRCPAKQS